MSVGIVAPPVSVSPSGSAVGTTRNINTTAPITGGGDLSADRTIVIPVATSGANGYLASGDWSTFNSKVSTTRQVIAGTGLTGGGTLSSDVTINMSSSLPNPSGIGVTPSGNGSLQIKAGNQTSVIAKGGGVIFDHFVDVNNSGTTETDLYSDSTPANILNTNGDKLEGQYGGTFSGAASATQELRAYFGGTLIFDSGALSIGVATDSWNLYITIIRDSATSIRCSSSLTTNFATLSAYAKYTAVTGLTLSNANILKITGQAGGISGASNQITASEGYVEWKSAA